MRFAEVVDNVLKVRPDEIRKTALAFTYLFCAIGAFIIGRIARTVLFLEIPDYKDQLPLMYVLIAATVSVMMTGYAKVERKLRRDHTNAITLGLLILGTLAFRFLLHDGDHAMYWAFYIWVEVYGSFLIVQFWTFTNEIFHSRQAKRLFAVIGGGGVLSNVFIGFAISGSVKSLGTENLLYVLSALLLVSLATVILLGRASKTELAAALERGPAQKTKAAGKVFQTRHVQLIAVVVVLTYVVSTLVDYQFQVIVGDSIPGKDDRSAYFGSFFGITGILAAIIQFTLTSRILERFGVLVALVLLPITMLGGSVGLLMVPLFSGLIAVSFTKGSENVLRYTLNDSTLQLLYLPVPTQIRGRVKAVIDGILKPVSIGGAGIILAICVGQVEQMLGVSLGFTLDVYALSYIVGFALVLWVVALVRLRREYVASLLSTLQKRRLNFADAQFKINDEGTIKTLEKALDSENVGDVLHAIELIGFVSGKARDGLQGRVSKLLAHPADEVRVAALGFLGAAGQLQEVAHVAELLDDAAPAVRAAATMAYCAMTRERGIQLVHPLLEDVSPQVRAAAVAALIRYCGLDGVLACADTLKQMLSAAEPKERERAAWVLGEIGVAHFYQPLVPLLEDKAESVRVAAIGAAGKLKNPELIPALISQLGTPRLAGPAANAIAALGPHVVEVAAGILADGTRPTAVRAQACKVLARVNDPRGIDVLSERLLDSEPEVRSGAITSLLTLLHHIRNARFDRKQIAPALRNEAEHAFKLLTLMDDLAVEASDALLFDALEHRLEQAFTRVFGLLALRYDSGTIDIVRRNLKSSAVATRANAVEVLDNLLDKDEKPYLIPLFEEQPRQKKISLGGDVFTLARRSREERLVELLESPDDWLRVAAAMTVAERKLASLVPKIEALLDSESAICRETAIVALQKLHNTGVLKHKLATLKDDPARAVRSYASHVLLEMT